MNCKYCGRNLESDFDFCPKCGEKITKGNFMVNIIESLDRMMRGQEKVVMGKVQDKAINTLLPKAFNQLKNMNIEDFQDLQDFEGEVPEMEGMPKGKFRIKIVTNKPRQAPQVQQQPAPKKQKEPTKKLKPVTSTVTEPQVSIKRRANRIYIEVLLPGITHFKDIQLNELEESVELRAFGKDKTYFKIIKLPLNSKIVDTKFENGKLTFTLM